MHQKIVFLGMGGTVAGTALSSGDNVGYKAAQVGVDVLLSSVPGMRHSSGNELPESEQVCQIDSKDLEHSDWVVLLERVSYHLGRSDVSGVVVTHGTDTLEETAYFLSQTVAPHWLQKKPLILTCAMRPASSLQPDGPGNMADAASVALHGGACGVLVVCAGKIHGAAQVQKVHPYRLDAFDSGETGPLGLVEEGRVRWLCSSPVVQAGPVHVDYWALLALGVPRVELLISHAGASGAVVHALLRDHGSSPLRGVVVAGTGNGTIHKDMEAALNEAQRQGVQVRRVSRCAYGQVVGARSVADSGEIGSYPLSPVKARIALMLEIARQSSDVATPQT
jgi:L-asparaginase